MLFSLYFYRKVKDFTTTKVLSIFLISTEILMVLAMVFILAVVFFQNCLYYLSIIFICNAKKTENQKKMYDFF